MAIDKAEYLRTLTAEHEALSAKLLDIESRLDEIDSEISLNYEPPDVSKMTPLERVMHEDGLRLAAQVAQQIAKSSPFLNILEGHEFCKK